MTAAAPTSLSILHVSQPADHGVARCVAALAADQIARGWAVGVACPAEGWLASEVRRLGATHHPWPAVRSPQAALWRERRALRAAMAAAEPDVVHLHSAKAGLTGRLVVRGRVATLFQPHAWSFLAVDGRARALAVSWERWAARWASTVICCSEDEARLGREVGIDARFHVVPNGVDLDRFRPADRAERDRLRAERGLTAEVPVVVCVGRLSPQKGQDLLVAAWPRVRAAVPGAELLLIGDGPDRGRLESTAGPGVRLLGEQADVRSWLALADVAGLPSRYEGMALGVLEAMACGRSVVATAADGMREALGEGDGAGGAVVALDDVDALAAAVVERLLDPGHAEAEGANSRRRVEEAHDLGDWVDALAALAVRATEARA